MRYLITGGCGFIGCNAAQRLVSLGEDVTILDNLSRPRTDRNLEWLKDQAPVRFINGDVRDYAMMTETVEKGCFDAIIHLAGQVAVTTSVQNPRQDFEVNALGTFNVLEAIRHRSPDSVLLFASTNKVYGSLKGFDVSELQTRYSLPSLPEGVSVSQHLDFHSPYGCSKGAADQYVVDYARIYGLRTVALRQSCIYGYRQFGVEDQGWVAWFIIAHVLGRPITVYGTGKQVRDILFIEDLIDCYLSVVENIASVAGMALNIGGGPANSLSLIELLALLSEISGKAVMSSSGDWRAGDQPVYVSDIGPAASLLKWRPRIHFEEGINRLYRWVEANQHLF